MRKIAIFISIFALTFIIISSMIISIIITKSSSNAVYPDFNDLELQLSPDFQSSNGTFYEIQFSLSLRNIGREDILIEDIWTFPEYYIGLRFLKNNSSNNLYHLEGRSHPHYFENPKYIKLHGGEELSTPYYLGDFPGKIILDNQSYYTELFNVSGEYNIQFSFMDYNPDINNEETVYSNVVKLTITGTQ